MRRNTVVLPDHYMPYGAVLVHAFWHAPTCRVNALICIIVVIMTRKKIDLHSTLSPNAGRGMPQKYAEECDQRSDRLALHRQNLLQSCDA